MELRDIHLGCCGISMVSSLDAPLSMREIAAVIPTFRVWSQQSSPLPRPESVRKAYPVLFGCAESFMTMICILCCRKRPRLESFHGSISRQRLWDLVNRPRSTAQDAGRRKAFFERSEAVLGVPDPVGTWVMTSSHSCRLPTVLNLLTNSSGRDYPTAGSLRIWRKRRWKSSLESPETKRSKQLQALAFQNRINHLQSHLVHQHSHLP